MNRNGLCDEADLLEETRISEGYLEHESVGPTLLPAQLNKEPGN